MVGGMRTPFSLLLLASLAWTPSSANTMTPGDRQRLVAHLEMTESWLLSELEGLTPQQLAFRIGPDTWNITDVVEHLAIAEPQYWKQARDSMRQPPATDKPEATDAAILWYGIDRTNRTRTGEARVPKGSFSDVRDSLAAFRKLRAEILEYARSTGEDPRAHRLVDGNMDVYQWCLMISAHSQRHILQIREIKAHTAYPKAAAVRRTSEIE